jgi:hypothetical protein
VEKRVGIMGSDEAALVILELVRKRGHQDVVLACTEPPAAVIAGAPVIALKDAGLQERELFITSSLAKSHVHQFLLERAGFGGRIICLPGLRHLSVSLRNDFSTPVKIEALAGSSRGRPAVVMGTGPTLQKTDPRLLEPPFLTLGGNGIVTLEGFQPDQFFTLDQFALDNWPEQITGLECPLFFPARLFPSVRQALPDTLPRATFFPLCYQQAGELDVSAWRTRGFEAGHTVSSPMLQFALLQGCNPIYLIGVDLSYDEKPHNYFTAGYHTQQGPGFSQSQAQKINNYMLESLGRVARHARALNVEVFNCSPRDSLPFLPYLPFEEALERHF